MRDFAQARTYSTKRPWLKIASLAFMAIIFLLGGFFVYAFIKVHKPFTQYSKPTEFTIESGESVARIAKKLQTEGLIGSSFIFRSYAVLRGSADTVQAGTFVLDSNMSSAEILSVVTGTKKKEEVRVTIPEGFTAAQIGARLENDSLVSAEEFAADTSDASLYTEFNFFSDAPMSASLEGFLFPDTYNFSTDTDVVSIVKKLLNNFQSKLSEDLRQEIERQGRTVFEVVTLASIIEAEVGRPAGQNESEIQEKLSEERRIVAGIFMNRLSIDHPLQSDATLGYALDIPRNQLTYEETQIDNPYNTYRYRGLPPGPINNPSLDSIAAAINPADTDYFYFLSKSDGEAVFARTLDEHNQNKAQYLQ